MHVSVSQPLTIPCANAATIVSRIAHDLEDIRRDRGGGAVFAKDLIERGYAQTTIDRYGERAAKLASELREAFENDGPLCCANSLAERSSEATTPSKVRSEAQRKVGAAIACTLAARA